MDYNENSGKLEQLEKQIQKLIAESEDVYFTDYLQKLLQRVFQEKNQVDSLQEELNRSYSLYQKRMNAANIPQSTQNAAQQGIISEAESSPAALEAEPNQAASEAELNPIASEDKLNPAAETEQPRPSRTIYTSANVWNPPQPKPVKKSNGEFVVGAVLLSIFGGAFILTALVMLGMNYMNGFIRGMSLYAAAAVVLVVSEVFLYRRWKLLGSTLSAIGIGGLYLSTAINYLGLGNFPGWVAMLITVGIMAFVILLSRKRDSIMYRILGLTACYFCFFPIQSDLTKSTFLPAVGMIFLANLACVLIPVKKHETEMNIVHIAANTFFTQVFLSRAFWSQTPGAHTMTFFISSFVILQLLYVRQVRKYRERTVGVRIAYGICSLFYLFTVFFETTSPIIGVSNETLYYVIALISVFVISTVSFLVLWKQPEKWYIYTLFQLMTVAVGIRFDAVLYTEILFLALLVLTKLLSVQKKPTVLFKINDAVLTAIICLIGLDLVNSENPVKRLYAGLIFGGVLFSILFIRYWQNYFKLILTYTAAGFLAYCVPTMLKLPIFVGGLFAGILLFNNVKRWQGKSNILFNALALSGQVICYLLLIHPVYRNTYFTYLFMLVFGVATIVLTFQEKYHMDFRGKSMIVACFLTYMAFIVKFELPVINSILMMLVALASVTAGFVERKRNTRIYGLVLSLLICGKMVLYDFIGAATLQKILLFFAVGVIALFIAGIYIVLEKKNSTNE